MKTRTLLLLSVACGLAIMLAGAVFFVQLAGRDEVDAPVSLGIEVDVGDMSVGVDEATETDGRLTVTVTLAGVADPAPAEDFRLIAAGTAVTATESTCAADDPEPQTCTVSFDVAAVDGASRVLFYERGDERVRWVLA